MKNKITIFLLLVAAILSAQNPRVFTVKCNVSQTGGGAGYWQVSATNINDPLGLYDATEIATGDALYLNDGGIQYKLNITTVVSAVGNSATFRVSNSGITGISSVPTTSAVISRGTPNHELLPWAANISDADNQANQEWNNYLIDSLLSVSGTGGDGIYGGSGTVPDSMVATSANTSRVTFQSFELSGHDGFTLKATDGTKTTYVTSYDDSEPFAAIANSNGTGLFLDGYTGGIMQIASGQTMRVTDSNAVQFGLQYSADYSANLKNNARSIPDVGTVNTLLTTLVPSMTAGSVVFSNGTTLAQDNANFFWDDTNDRLSIGNSATAGASQLSVRRDNIGVTQGNSYGIVLANNTAATAGNQQMSPPIRWRGQGWKTTATAGSQTVDFRADVLPVQGSTAPSATWQLAFSINGGAYSNFLTASTSGSYYIGLPGAGAISNTLGLVTVDRYNFGISRDGSNQNVILSSSVAVAASGTVNFISTPFSVAPTSGTLVTNAINVNGTINQTGGASGITRGLYIAPTLTSAADWRAIETTAGSLVMGDTYLAGSGSLAGSLVNLTQTWNTTGTPTAIKLNVTDAASNASSLLMDLQVGGSSKFQFTKKGAIKNAIFYSTTGGANGGLFLNSGSSTISSSANGAITLYDNTGTSFNLLQFGGTTSSFPALKRSTTTLQVRLADDSAYAVIQSLYMRFGSGSPEGVVTAPVGTFYSRTDGGAGTSFYVKESGTGNTGWVAK